MQCALSPTGLHVLHVFSVPCTNTRCLPVTQTHITGQGLTCVYALGRAQVCWCQTHMEPLCPLGVLLSHPLRCCSLPAAWPRALARAQAGAAWAGHSRSALTMSILHGLLSVQQQAILCYKISNAHNCALRPKPLLAIHIQGIDMQLKFDAVGLNRVLARTVHTAAVS